MKIIWNPALTLDGYIAKTNGDSDWVSDEDGEFFWNLIKKAGCVIVGRTTYEKYKNGVVFPVPEALTFVLTSHPETGVPADGVEFIKTSPNDLIAQLEKRGFTQAVLAGGGKTSSEFAQAGLIDEIIANIYPMTFGEGIKLLNGNGCNLDLELLDVQRLQNGIVQHTYRVHKAA